MSPAPAKKVSSTARLKRVGPYRILREVGRGGMGRVYRGLHESLQREVAVKELLANPNANDEMVSRFRREALALAAFRHQNIVTLYDLVEKGDALLMVMEYVDGPTLGQLLQQGPIPPEVVAVLGARLAGALEHAHSHRILHRDLKPSNVMVTGLGEVKLMDFGIAKDEGLTTLTREGIAVGTPSYMSPEQIAGAELDPRSDIFSLGVMLYECLAGERPFPGVNAGEIFARIRDGKPKKLSQVAPHVPKDLAKTVMRAMAKDPSQRHPEASDLRRDLEAFLVKRVQVSHAGLLMAFLRHQQHIPETQALAHLSRRELAWIERFERFGRFDFDGKPARKSWRLWGLVAGAAGVGGGLALAQLFGG